MDRRIKKVSGGVYEDPSGRTLTLCVVEELNPDEAYSQQAVATYKGFSLCQKHLVKAHELFPYDVNPVSITQLMK